MQHHAFSHAATTLYGPRWKGPFAAYCGVSRETVSRWAHGHQPIPTWVERLLHLQQSQRGVVLSLCDKSGIMVKPWADAGFDCLCVDIAHEETRQEGRITYLQADIRTWLPPPQHYAIVFAFPPCTDLAASGAAWFQDKGFGPLESSLALVEASRRIATWTGAPWLIENPVGILSSYWRKPDYTFNPCDYGGYLDPPSDAYTKRTCLWTGGGFKMPPKKPVAPVEGSKMNKMPDSKGRAERRSLTPTGFARAVMLANISATYVKIRGKKAG